MKIDAIGFGQGKVEVAGNGAYSFLLPSCFLGRVSEPAAQSRLYFTQSVLMKEPGLGRKALVIVTINLPGVIRAESRVDRVVDVGGIDELNAVSLADKEMRGDVKMGALRKIVMKDGSRDINFRIEEIP